MLARLLLTSSATSAGRDAFQLIVALLAVSQTHRTQVHEHV